MRRAEPGEFQAAISSADQGQLESDLNRKLIKMVEQVIGTGAKAKLSLELVIEPAGGAKVEIHGQVKTTEPLVKRNGAYFWFSDGKLTRNNPEQQELPYLRAEPGGAE